MFFGRAKHRKAQRVRELFVLEWKIASNAYSDLYAAQDRQRSEKCVVCVSRSGLSEKQQKSFETFVKKLTSVRINHIQDYGVDNEGRGYVALLSAAYKRLDFDRPDVGQLRRRFLMSLVLIERLHQNGIVCGHLSSDSFLLDAEMRPQFVDFVGFSPVDAGAPSISNEFLIYRRRSDEQQGRVFLESDVYALAVIGLKLFGAQFPPGFIEKTALPEYVKEMRQDTPQWVYTILLSILENPAKRLFSDSSHLLTAIALNEKTAQDKASNDGMLQEARRVTTKMGRGRSRSASIVGASVITIAAALIGAVFVIRTSPGTQEVAWNGDPAPDPPSEDALDDRTQERLALLGSRDDPRVHQKLEKIVREASTPEVRRMAWIVVADRLARLGSARTGRTLREAVIALKDEALLNLLTMSAAFDPYQELGARQTMLAERFKVDPQFGCNLIVAAALDSSTLDDWKDLLKICAERRGDYILRNRDGDLSALALVAILDDQVMRYSEDIKDRAVDLSEADIVWLLSARASGHTAMVRMLAEVALSKNMIQWPRRVFMQAFESTASYSGTPSDSLIRSAIAGPSEADVAQYTAWYDPESVKVLFAVLLESRDETVLSLAFDALDNKPLGDQLTRDLMDFVKARAAESRARYTNLVGGVALREEIDEAVLSKYLLSIQGVPIERDVYMFLLHHGDVKVVKAVLDVKGAILNPVSLVDLLKNGDRKVRALVVPYLKTISVASARRAVGDFYLGEQDPEVRALFEREIPWIGLTNQHP